jgi:hypothetical protein
MSSSTESKMSKIQLIMKNGSCAGSTIVCIRCMKMFTGMTIGSKHELRFNRSIGLERLMKEFTCKPHCGASAKMYAEVLPNAPELSILGDCGYESGDE